MTLLEERGGVIGHAPSGEKARPGSSMPSRSWSGVAIVPPVGAEGQTGSAARLIARLEAEAYGTWQQAFAEVYGR